VRVIRLVTPGDAAALAGLVQANREFLARWEPVRGPGYFTVDGQRAVIAAALSRYDQGEGLPCVILADDGRIAGRISAQA